MITSHNAISLPLSRTMSFLAGNPLQTRPMKGRRVPPSHCLFKIASFSLLSKASVENYTTEEFGAGGYEWTLSIYPAGNKKKDGQDHISVYLNLMVKDSSLFPVGWEVNAIVDFFVYDFLGDEYFFTQDASIRHFHKLQLEWGIPKFIDLALFNDPSNGYLIEDTCVFGAEIFIVKPTSKGDYLSMIDDPPTLSHRWRFDNYSKANLEKYESASFFAGNYKWKLVFYPNGLMEGKDYRHFSSSASTWGSRMFVPLAKLKDPNNGFLEGNSCIFEAEFKVLGLIKAP